MVRVYANLIIAGRKKFSEVLAKDKEAVKAELERRVTVKQITSEQLQELLDK